MTQDLSLAEMLDTKSRRKLVIDYYRREFYNKGLATLNELRKFELDLRMNSKKVAEWYKKIMDCYTSEVVDQEASDLKEQAELPEWMAQQERNYISSFSN